MKAVLGSELELFSVPTIELERDLMRASRCDQVLFTPRKKRHVEPLCYWRAVGKSLLLPRGLTTRAREICVQHGVSLEIEDSRVQAPATFSRSVDGLRDYQIAAIDALERLHQGLVIMPCGAGKSMTGIGAIARLGQKTIILVHTKDLKAQWEASIDRVLAPDPSQIRVEMIQSIVALPERERVFAMKGYGLMILDEAHHVPASTFTEVVSLSAARYRLGLTATPDRTDGLGPALGMHFGPVLHAVSHEDLYERGLLIRPEIVRVETGYRYDYRDPKDWAPMLGDLARDADRIGLIASTVEASLHEGQALVLAGRIDYCASIWSALSALGIDAIVVSSREKDRAAKIEDMRKCQYRVMIATQLADEGLDLPSLSSVHLTWPSRSAGRTIQRCGRAMRPSEGKRSAKIFDYVDSRVPVLLHQARARARAMRGIGG